MTRSLQTIAFVLGLAVIGWIGAGYLGGHALALGVTLLIAAVYLAGTLELWRYDRATAQLTQALAAAAAPSAAPSAADPTAPPASLAAWLLTLPASLRQPVRLRVEGERGALPGPALAPTLSGLLVLLGMLGTFLGMVVTLNGTGAALEGASDVASIRAALSAPVQGLGLAFGTSVAGVAGSAMLGFIAALSRRARLAAAQLLEAGIATTLRPFSAAQRRDAQFALLQDQARGMPALVDALHATLAALERQGGTTAAALQGHAEATAAALRGQSETTATALQRQSETTATVLQRQSDSASAALQGHASATTTALGTQAEALATTLARQAEAMTAELRRQSDATTADLQRQLDVMRATLQAQSEDMRSALQLHAETTTGALQAQAASTTSALHGHVETTSATLHRQVQALTGALDAQSRALAEQLGDGQRHFHARTEAVFTGLAAAVESSLKTSLDDAARSAGATIAPAVQATMAGLARESEALHVRASALWQEALAAHQRHTAETHSALQAALAAQEQDRVAAWTATLEATSRTLLERTEASADATIAEVGRLMQSAAEAPRAAAAVVAELRQHVAASLARDRAEHAERVSRDEKMLAERRAREDTIDAERAARERALGAERNGLLEAHTAAVQAATRAASEQRAAIDTLVQASDAMLARTGARFGEHVDAHAGTLGTVSARLAGGAAEVASLGEAFGLAVERFCTSNEQLGAQLQRIEGALGASLARSDEQLAYYVAQAREVIDLSILSQNQIIEDLRSLAPRPALAGSDA